MDPDHQENYSKDEVVWAKVRGYPWWPGLIAKLIVSKDGSEPTKYLINFIGDNSHSTLPAQSLAKYQEKYNEIIPKIKTNKNLKESIQTADQIIKGNTNYEVEVKKLQQKKFLIEEQPNPRRRKGNRKFSSSSEDRFGSSRKPEIEPQFEPFNVEQEITSLLKLITENKVNVSQIEHKIQNIALIIEKEKPDILQILQGPNGKNLMQIQKSLEIKNQNGSRNLTQATAQVQQLIEKLKTILLKLYFDPTEIIQQLHQVSGQKKITQKLLEKLSNQPELIFDYQSSDSSDNDSNSVQSDSVDKPRLYQQKLQLQKINSIKQQQQQQQQLQHQQKKNNSKLKRSGNKIKKFKKLNDSPINQIANPDLRKKVCHKILQLISLTNLDSSSGKKISVEIETKLREMDPDMGAVYKQKFQKIVENLKKIKKNELNDVLGSNDFDRLWSKQTVNIDLLSQNKRESDGIEQEIEQNII